MAATTINIQELLFILEQTPSTQNIMLAGRHGIGKSEILTDFYESKGLQVVALFLGQMSDPGDLIGLPDKHGDKTEFLPPYWFPTDGKPIVLFLDELNRARPEILQGVMDLALNRKLAGHSLPQGSRIIAAVNEGSEYQVEELDPALVSRFNIYRFEPSVQEWVNWAEESGLDSRVVGFIRNNPSWLENESAADGDLSKTPDRRAWKRVSDIIKPFHTLDGMCFKLVSGIIGAEATTKFFGEQVKKFDADDFLRNFDKHKSELASYQMHEFAAMNDLILGCLGTVSHRDAISYVKGLNGYVNYLDTHNIREAFAHFAFNYNNQSKETKTLINSYLPGMVQKLSSYQKTI